MQDIFEEQHKILWIGITEKQEEERSRRKRGFLCHEYKHPKSCFRKDF